MEKNSFLKTLDVNIDDDEFIVESKKTFFTPSFKKIVFISAKEDLESSTLVQTPETSFMVFKKKIKDNFDEQAKTNRGLYIMKKWCNKDVETTLRNILEEKKEKIHKLWSSMLLKSCCFKTLIFQNKVKRAINCFKNYKLNKYLSEIEIQKIKLLKKEKELDLLFSKYKEENELLKQKLISSVQSPEKIEKDFSFLKTYSKISSKEKWFGLTKNDSLMIMIKLLDIPENILNINEERLSSMQDKEQKKTILSIINTLNKKLNCRGLLFWLNNYANKGIEKGTKFFERYIIMMKNLFEAPTEKDYIFFANILHDQMTITPRKSKTIANGYTFYNLIKKINKNISLFR